METSKKAGTWQEAGSGNPPLLWNVKYWPEAAAEADFLTDSQYWHLAEQLREMAREQEPLKCATVDIAPIEEFWELKDKGGVLGKLNLRIYLDVNARPPLKEIVVLGVHKKEDEGQLRRSVVVRIQRRRRLYWASCAANKGERP